jgi:hypothetical protein
VFMGCMERLDLQRSGLEQGPRNKFPRRSAAGPPGAIYSRLGSD